MTGLTAGWLVVTGGGTGGADARFCGTTGLEGAGVGVPDGAAEFEGGVASALKEGIGPPTLPFTFTGAVFTISTVAGINHVCSSCPSTLRSGAACCWANFLNTFRNSITPVILK